TFITAAEAGRIADRYMVPAFRDGDYGRGILGGVVAIAQEYAERFGFELTGEVAAREIQRDGGGGAGLLFFIIVVIVLLLLLSGRSGRGRGGRRRRHGMPVIIPFPMGGRHRGGFGGFGGGFGGF